MPNGENRNWVRFLKVLTGFNVRFGCWPTRLYLPRYIIDYLPNYLSKEDFSKIEEKLELIADDRLIIAEDNEGRVHDFMKEGFPSHPDVKPTQWLCIGPPHRY
jgi:hypothetical protein